MIPIPVALVRASGRKVGCMSGLLFFIAMFVAKTQGDWAKHYLASTNANGTVESAARGRAQVAQGDCGDGLVA